MARFEVFIPSSDPDGINMTLRVTADTWMAALKVGLKKIGEAQGMPKDVLCDIQDDESIHVTDPRTQRVFRIQQIPDVSNPGLLPAQLPKSPWMSGPSDPSPDAKTVPELPAPSAAEIAAAIAAQKSKDALVAQRAEEARRALEKALEKALADKAAAEQAAREASALAAAAERAAAERIARDRAEQEARAAALAAEAVKVRAERDAAERLTAERTAAEKAGAAKAAVEKAAAEAKAAAEQAARERTAHEAALAQKAVAERAAAEARAAAEKAEADRAAAERSAAQKAAAEREAAQKAESERAAQKAAAEKAAAEKAAAAAERAAAERASAEKARAGKKPVPDTDPDPKATAAAAAPKKVPSSKERVPVVKVVAVDKPKSPPPAQIGRVQPGPADSGPVEDVLSELFERTPALFQKPLDEALYYLLDLAMEKVPVDSGTVYVADLNRRDLAFAAVRGPKAKELLALKLRVPMGKGFVGFCAQEGVAVAMSDVHRDKRFFREISDRIGYETRSMITTPIILHGRTLGALQLINKKGSSVFTQGELSILHYLAHQGALLLEARDE
jgi:GAF domain